MPRPKLFTDEELKLRKNLKAAERYKNDADFRKSRSDYHKALRDKKKNEDPLLQKKESEKARIWRENNVEKALETARKSREKYKEKRNKGTRKWFAENRDKATAYTVLRKASKIKRTPLWADKNKINYFYFIARFFSSLSDEKWVVDHIIPLRGKNVSGFHSQDNLQVIPAKLNLEKSNKTESFSNLLIASPTFTESDFLRFMYPDLCKKTMGLPA